MYLMQMGTSEQHSRLGLQNKNLHVHFFLNRGKPKDFLNKYCYSTRNDITFPLLLWNFVVYIVQCR